MKLAIMTISYDYFDYDGKYHKPVTTIIDGALDAWNFYQSERAKDYDHGDSYRETHIDRLPRDYGYATPTHNIHGQRFGHKPTIEEKLRRAVDDALIDWTEANDAYKLAYSEFCALAAEEGLCASETLDAEEYAHKLHSIAEELWEKVEEAEAKRDAYWEYQGSLREHLGYDPEDADLFPELEECLPF